MAVSVSELQYALRTLWPQDRIKTLSYADHPFFAALEKTDDFYETDMYIVQQDRRNQARSAVFATALAQAGTATYGAPGGCRFLLPRRKDYALFAMETETLMAADNAKLIDGYDRVMKGALESLSAALAANLIRGQGGSLGKLGATAATAMVAIDATSSTVKFANPEDIVGIENGMQVGLSTADTASSALVDFATTETITYGTVTSVNRDAGTFVLTHASATAISDMSNKFVVPYGDTGGVKSLGLIDWLPSSAPDSTAFLGVDRSVDVVRRAGARIDISALNPEEGLATALTKMSMHNASPRRMFVNPSDYLNFMISLGSKVETVYESIATINFEALRVRGPRGVVSITGDADIPKGRGFLLDMATWTFHHMGGVPKVLDMDGAILSRSASADAWEGRMVYFGNLACDAVGNNANVTLAS